MKKIVIILAMFGFIPGFVLAQSGSSYCSSLGGLLEIVCRINQLLASLLPVLVALGVIYFVYGVVTYFIGANSEEAKKAGRDKIVFGIAGLAVILGMWGLVAILSKTVFRNDNISAPENSDLQNLLPNVEFPSSDSGLGDV